VIKYESERKRESMRESEKIILVPFKLIASLCIKSELSSKKTKLLPLEKSFGNKI